MTNQTLKDPKIETENYMKEKQVMEIFQLLTSHLMYNKPEDPVNYLIDLLRRMKTTGIGNPLLTRRDFEAMFGMIDITNKGTITVAQATQALRTVQGPQAVLDGYPDGSTSLSLDAFCTAMEAQLIGAAPRVRESRPEETSEMEQVPTF